MSIKNKIVFKKPMEKKKEKLYEKDRPRYEEQSEEEYLRHCERFFKGWEDDSKTQENEKKEKRKNSKYKIKTYEF